MIEHKLTTKCPDCRKEVIVVYYDENGRHMGNNVYMLRVQMAANIYRITCNHCGCEFTSTTN